MWNDNGLNIFRCPKVGENITNRLADTLALFHHINEVKLNELSSLIPYIDFHSYVLVSLSRFSLIILNF